MGIYLSFMLGKVCERESIASTSPGVFAFSLISI